jgi:hypothetical protein
MYKLPEEVKTKWVAALRSGDYKQDYDTLNSGEGFCCLGVLAEVLEPGITGRDGKLENVRSLSVALPAQKLCREHDIWNVLEQPTDAALRENAKVVSPNAFLLGKNIRTVGNLLMTINDGRSTSFGQLADFIEGNL